MSDIEDSHDELFNKMLRISIIDHAIDELEMGIELHPDTEKDLESIDIDPKEFIRRFQESESC